MTFLAPILRACWTYALMDICRFSSPVPDGSRHQSKAERRRRSRRYQTMLAYTGTNSIRVQIAAEMPGGLLPDVIGTDRRSVRPKADGEQAVRGPLTIAPIEPRQVFALSAALLPAVE